MTACCDSVAPVIRISDPWGLYLIALSRMLMTAGRSSTGIRTDGHGRIACDDDPLPALIGKHGQVRRHIVDQRADVDLCGWTSVRPLSARDK